MTSIPLLGLNVFLTGAAFWPRPEISYENELLKSLRPRAEVALRWRETWESTNDFSGLELGLAVGSFPRSEFGFFGGLELGTGDGRSPRVLALGDGFSSKSLSLHQVYAGYENSWATVQAGKFRDALWTSPLTLSSEIALEGFFQSFRIIPRHLKVFASQGLLIQRSWVLIQGLRGIQLLDETTELRWSLTSFYFLDPPRSQMLANGRRGNTIRVDQAGYQHEYYPIELAFQLLGRPLGISTGLVGAAAINFGSSDNQRGFFAQGFIGIPWQKGGWVAAASYLYAEPDVSFALLTSEDLGSLNRKGFRGEISYFPLSQLRLGGAFSLLQTIQSRADQHERKELLFETQLIF